MVETIIYNIGVIFCGTCIIGFTGFLAILLADFLRPAKRKKNRPDGNQDGTR